MTETSVQRRLAAILAADVVGYSKMMGEDEAGTQVAVRKFRAEVIEPKVAKHQGRLFKSMGDGFLVEFPSVVNAVACAAAIQTAMASRNTDLPEDRRLQLRIGVNLGDVIVEGDDVFGDGVNLAARLEGFAPPGGVAVSSTVREQIGNRLDVEFEEVGVQRLKNIDRPVTVSLLQLAKPVGEPKPALQLPDKPSIAVLPFTNMSSEPEQEYFADGITEDLITALSRIGELFVISRNSSFVYKNQRRRIEDISREFGVRYVVEGSVRVAGSRLRVTAQLIDGLHGNHVWAERYDEKTDDVFAVQDRITHDIALALQIKLTYGEFARLWEGQTKSIRAWERMALARRHFLQFNNADNEIARKFLKDALDIDANYTGAMVLLGLTYWVDARFNLDANRETSLSMASAQADRVLEIDPSIGSGHMLRGGVAFLRDNHDEAVRLCEDGVRIAPNDSWAIAFLGLVYNYSGKPRDAIAVFKTAMRLSPHPPHWYTYGLAIAYTWAGELGLAEETALLNIRQEPDDPYSYMNLAMVYSFGNKSQDFGRQLQELKSRFPSFGLANIRRSERYRDAETLERVIGVFRQAGLPE